MRDDRRDDPDETAGRRLYRAIADRYARAQLATTLRRVTLPPEFARDTEIQRAIIDPLEEIWAHRLRLM